MATTQYDVFISYSRADYIDAKGEVIEGNVVSKIKDTLTQEGITFWFDEEGIYSGDTFTEKIVVNIEAADIFLFISSANSNRSVWTSKEIATADEFHKRIIPIRIDNTPYNKKVMFRIADIDFIDYFNNPEKGIDDMIRSINTFKEQKAELEKAEKERIEREQRKKEEEERRRIEEQQQLVESIKLQCAKLNGEETRIDIDRKSLLLSLSKISNKEQQAQLKHLIETSSPVHKRAIEAHAEIIKKLEETQKKLDESQKQQALLQQQLNESQKTSQEVANLKKQISEQAQTITLLQSKLSTTNQLNQAQVLKDSASAQADSTSNDNNCQKQPNQDEISITPDKPYHKFVDFCKSHKNIFFIYGGIILIPFIIMTILFLKYISSGISDDGKEIFAFCLGVTLFIVLPIFIIHIAVLLYNQKRNNRRRQEDNNI